MNSVFRHAGLPLQGRRSTAKDGGTVIRHPETLENTGFRLSAEILKRYIILHFRPDAVDGLETMDRTFPFCVKLNMAVIFLSNFFGETGAILIINHLNSRF